MEYLIDPSLALALLAGIGIAAACGLRAFLPLLLLGLAGRAGWIELQPGAAWLESRLALWALGSAAVLEIAADKIPVVDHALDVVGTLLRPASAWLGAYAVLHALPAPWAQLVALGLGGFALLVHGLKAKLRLGSTAVTLGHGNPILSVAEDVLALIGAVIALVMPILVVILIALLIWAALRRRGSLSSTAPDPH